MEAPIGGLGYSFSWGQVIGTWRYLDYKFKSGSAVRDLDFRGLMIGVAFNWQSGTMRGHHIRQAGRDA